jgi:hypothetical protein
MKDLLPVFRQLQRQLIALCKAIGKQGLKRDVIPQCSVRDCPFPDAAIPKLDTIRRLEKLDIMHKRRDEMSMIHSLQLIKRHRMKKLLASEEMEIPGVRRPSGRGASPYPVF